MNKLFAVIARGKAFVGDVGAELKKSAWPPRSELQESTVVVILSVIALGIFVGLSDLILMRLLNLVL